MRALSVIVACLVAPLPALAGPLTVAPHLASHMVLQQGKPAPFRGGGAQPGEEVTVSFGAVTARARADAQGNWQVSLPPLPRGQSGTVEIRAAGGTTLRGEIGSCGPFRLVVVPEMMKWSGAGADASASSNSYETNNRFDIFPFLVVGDESFTTIGFQTDGKTVKFSITHKKPGKETADRNDPYGETGFMSIKWYYGFMVLRSERIALLKTVARL